MAFVFLDWSMQPSIFTFCRVSRRIPHLNSKTRLKQQAAGTARNSGGIDEVYKESYGYSNGLACPMVHFQDSDLKQFPSIAALGMLIGFGGPRTINARLISKYSSSFHGSLLNLIFMTPFQQAVLSILLKFFQGFFHLLSK